MKEYKVIYFSDVGRINKVKGDKKRTTQRIEEYLNNMSKSGWDLVNININREHWNDGTTLIFCKGIMQNER